MFGFPPQQTDHSLRFSELDMNDPKDAARAVHKHLATRDFKKSMEQSFLTNLDFLEGGYKQWRKWDTKTNRRVLDPAISKDDTLISFNLILELAETLVSRLIRHKPIAHSKAVSTDHRDMRRARMMEDILGYFYTIGLEMTVELARFILTVLCSDAGAWMVGGWDPNRGEIISTTLDDFIDAQIEQQVPEGFDVANISDADRIKAEVAAVQKFGEMFGSKALKSGKIVQYAGDLHCDIATILEMSWYPWRIKTWDEVQFYIRSTEVTVDQVAERLSMTTEEVRYRALGQHSGKSGLPPLAREGRERPQSRFTYGGSSDEGDCDVVMYHQFHVKPSIKYPEGVQGVVLGSDPKAMRVGPIDNYYHEFPYFPLVQHDIPNQAFGTCLVSQLRSGQIDLNKAASQETMFRDQNIFPTIIVPEEGIVDENNWQLSNRPGKQHRVRGGRQNAPFVLERPQVGMEHLKSIDRDVSFMREISSVSAIQAGKTDDAHIRSGRAVQALDEKTNERLISFSEKINKHQRKFWSFQAVELQKKPTGQRVAQILGEDNQIEMLEWTRDELRPTTWNVPGRAVTIITVEAFTDMPMSRAENRNFVMALVKGGILRPGEHDAEIWRMIGAGDAGRFRDKERKDRAKASWRIDQWRRGQLVSSPIRQEQHLVHIDEIVEWMRSGNEYEELIQKFPYLHEHIEHHIRLHEMHEMIEKSRIPLMQQRAQVEAWLGTIRDIGKDVERQTADPMLLQLTDLMLPLANIIGGGMAGAPMPGAQQVESSPPAQKQPGSPQAAMPQQQNSPTEHVGMGEERDRRRDLADAGVPRGNIVST